MNDVSLTATVQPAEPIEEQRALLEASLAAHPYGDQDEEALTCRCCAAI